MMPNEQGSSDAETQRQPGGESQGLPARAAVDELYRIAYDELRHRAAAIRRGDPFADVSTKTLIHESWLKLAASPEFGIHSPLHLWNIVTGAMRQVLVDAARRRRAGKREGLTVPLDDSLPLVCEPSERVLHMHEVLTRLERLDAEQAWIVEARFFGGLGFAEIAQLLGSSESTVRRRWDSARALLRMWLTES